MSRTPDPRRPRLDPRLAGRLTRKKATLDRYRPLPQETVHHLNDDLRIFLTYHSNAIEGNTLSLLYEQLSPITALRQCIHLQMGMDELGVSCST